MTDPSPPAFVIAQFRADQSCLAMGRDLAAALRRHGCAAEQVAGDDEPAFVAAVRRRIDAGAVLVDVNARVSLAARRRLSLIVDHPALHFEALRTATPGHVLALIDTSHRRAARALGLAQPTVFLPHAGPPPEAAPPPARQRDIPVLFVGSLWDPVAESEWRRRNPGVPEVVADAMFETVERMDAEPVPVLDGFVAACARRGVDALGEVAAPELAQVLARIEAITEINRRHRVLAALAPLGLHVVSPARPEWLARLAGATWLGSRPFFEAAHLYRRARLALNVVAKYPDGGHERLWYAIAAGSVPVTDRGRYVQDSYRDGMMFLGGAAGLERDAAGVAAALEAPGRLDAMAESARRTYRRRDTWDARVPVILRALGYPA